VPVGHKDHCCVAVAVTVALCSLNQSFDLSFGKMLAGSSTSIGDEAKAYAVRVGALRQRNELVPRRQGFVRSQQSWVNDLNSIAKFDGMPPH
jgi:hypothetical protein